MGREATPYESKSQLFFAFVWLAVTALLLAVFQSVGTPQAFGSETTLPSSSEFQLVGPDPSDESLPSVLNGGVLWSVVDVEVTPTDDFLGRAVINVNLELTNTLAETRLRASVRDVGLVTADGFELPAGRFVDAGPRVTIEPGAREEVTLRVLTGHDREPEPADLTLVISESNRIPASIPLDGTRPEQEAPILLAVEATPSSMPDPDDATRQVVVELRAGSIGVNAGPYRAAVGERLAVLKVNVQRADSSETSAILGPDFWSLSVDGEPFDPIAVTSESSAADGEEVTLLFAFPDDASAFRLSAGLDGGPSSDFALVTPAVG